jgi:hypothetical protein
LIKASGASSTERIAFAGELITWDKLPAASRRAARRGSPLVAEAVQLDPREWTEDGRAFEMATGWRVYEDAVIVVGVVRAVAPAPAGGTRPIGPWEHRGVWVSEASGPARRWRGVVDVAGELRGARGQGGAAVVPSEHHAAAEAWTYLPQVVRAAAERLVPEPVIWLGQIVQEHSADRFPTRQDVRVLRMSKDRAVVVLAGRTLVPIPGAGLDLHVSQMAKVPWLVEQVGLDLVAPDVRGELGAAQTATS